MCVAASDGASWDIHEFSAIQPCTGFNVLDTGGPILRPGFQGVRSVDCNPDLIRSPNSKSERNERILDLQYLHICHPLHLFAFGNISGEFRFSFS